MRDTLRKELKPIAEKYLKDCGAKIIKIKDSFEEIAAWPFYDSWTETIFYIDAEPPVLESYREQLHEYLKEHIEKKYPGIHFNSWEDHYDIRVEDAKWVD